jgi:hypothetical protein
MRHSLTLKKESFMINMAKKVLEMEVANLKDLEIYLTCLAWEDVDRKVKGLKRFSPRKNRSK